LQLPIFKYNKNPYENGIFIKSSDICLCCGNMTGWLYTGSCYLEANIDGSFCPWCINNGKAALKFDVSFIDVYGIEDHVVDKEIIKELQCKTPNYSSWQDHDWLYHCNEPAQFINDATPEDIVNISKKSIEIWKVMQNDPELELWKGLSTQFIEDNGFSSVTFYKFKCKNCKTEMFNWELS